MKGPSLMARNPESLVRTAGKPLLSVLLCLVPSSQSSLQHPQAKFVSSTKHTYHDGLTVVHHHPLPSHDQTSGKLSVAHRQGPRRRALPDASGDLVKTLPCRGRPLLPRPCLRVRTRGCTLSRVTPRFPARSCEVLRRCSGQHRGRGPLGP